MNFTSFHDPVFGVIWLARALLWAEFFGLMALGRESITRATCWSLLLLGQVTTTVPAFFILTGHYAPTSSLAVLAAVGYAVLFGAAFTLGRRGAIAVAPAEAAPTGS